MAVSKLACGKADWSPTDQPTLAPPNHSPLRNRNTRRHQEFRAWPEALAIRNAAAPARRVAFESAHLTNAEKPRVGDPSDHDFTGSYEWHHTLNFIPLASWGVGKFVKVLNGWKCFAAGTPILTPDGSKPIERIEPGDVLLSRWEEGPEHPVEEAVVEAVFTRFAPILELTLGGRIIRTTAEHPFWSMGQGWVSAGLLKPGDLLAGFDGEWLLVEKVVETGEDEIVYNMRVGGHHTYFVGDADWGWAVWAHNASYLAGNATTARNLARYGGAEQRAALLNQVRASSSLSEAKGVVHAFREMKRLGYQLQDVSLHYRGNQGLDLIFYNGSRYAVVEAKHGRHLSLLKTDTRNLRQGSLDYNVSRLERYLQYGSGTHSDLVDKLLVEASLGQLESFGTFYRSGRVLELPLGWPTVSAIFR